MNKMSKILSIFNTFYAIYMYMYIVHEEMYTCTLQVQVEHSCTFICTCTNTRVIFVHVVRADNDYSSMLSIKGFSDSNSYDMNEIFNASESESISSSVTWQLVSRTFSSIK